MISSSAEILFALLRAALGKGAVLTEASGEGTEARSEGLDLGSVSGEVWKEVIDLSFEQGVGDVLEASPTKTMVRQAHQPTKTGAEAGDVVEVMGESLERRDKGVRRMLEDILAPKQVRHFESRFLAHLNILRMLWTNRRKFRLYSDTTFFATVFRYLYGHWFDRDNVTD